MYAKAPDGTKIPMSIVHLKGQYKEHCQTASSPKPTLLYGYGSYGICIDPGFDRRILPLLDRGVTYVIAHIRGGGEMGQAWYEQQGQPFQSSSFMS